MRHSTTVLLLARDRFLSLLLLHIVPLLIAVGLKILLFLLVLVGVPLRSISLDNLQNWAGAGTFKPSSPIMKPVPKRLRTLLCCEPTLPSAGTLPARSLLNDLVRLRGAIITSCICGATKELKESPAGLTFLVRGRAFRRVVAIYGLWW